MKRTLAHALLLAFCMAILFVLNSFLEAHFDFNYPLYIAVLVVPLGLFDLETAKNIWLIVSEMLLVPSIHLLVGRTSGLKRIVLSILGCVAFVPTLMALFDQQTSMFVLLLLSVVYYGLKMDCHALALSLIKPQAAALLVLVTLFRLRREGLTSEPQLSCRR